MPATSELPASTSLALAATPPWQRACERIFSATIGRNERKQTGGGRVVLGVIVQVCNAITPTLPSVHTCPIA